MSTIQILADKLYGGFEPVLTFYNYHKPADAMPLCEANIAELGFEILLNPTELNIHLEYIRLRTGGRLTNYNDTVKQLRISGNGFLTSGYYMGFSEEETELLFLALKHSLGENKVIMV